MKLYNLKLTEAELYQLQIWILFGINQCREWEEINRLRSFNNPTDVNFKSNIKIYEGTRERLESALNKIEAISPFKDLKRKKESNESTNQSIQPSK